MSVPLKYLGLSAAALALTAATAVAEPGPGAVEVRDDRGTLIGDRLRGDDAIQAAVARVESQRTVNSRRWSVIAGAGTYGDVAISTPNLVLRAAQNVRAGIRGTGGSNGTGGGCIDVRAGKVLIANLDCASPPGVGVEIAPPATAIGVVLQGVGVSGSGGEGILVRSGKRVQLLAVSVSGAGGAGVRFEGLRGPGPYEMRAGAVRGGRASGIVVTNSANVGIAAVTVAGNADDGISIVHPQNSAVVVDSAVIQANGRNGMVISQGSGNAVLRSQFSGNGGSGVVLGAGAGLRIEGNGFDGTNRADDVRFSTAARTGGSYVDLNLLGTRINALGEPNGVAVAAATAAQRLQLAAPPAGLSGLNRVVRVRDLDADPGSGITLRFGFSPTELAGLRPSGLTVYEHDRAGNPAVWEALPTAPLAANGALDVTLTDPVIASGSDDRFAFYAPFGPFNAAPQVASVYPNPGVVNRGRKLVIGAAVADDGPLTRRSFRLVVDGRNRGGAVYRAGIVRYRLTLRPGLHGVVLRVRDDAGQETTQSWRFRVRNAKPTVDLRRALPRPGSFRLSRGPVAISIPVRDDQTLQRRRVRMLVDGQAVTARLRDGRLRARPVLEQGRHRVVVVVRDRDGARTLRTWTFRSVRP